MHRPVLEAFAESYRVLVDGGRGVPFLRPIVDASFIPGPRALEAIRQDVLVPWSPTTIRSRGRLRPGGTARYAILTPYDGTLTVRVVPRSARARVTLTTAAGAVLKRGVGRATATICGQRRVRLVVRALSGSGRFTLTVTKP